MQMAKENRQEEAWTCAVSEKKAVEEERPEGETRIRLYWDAHHAPQCFDSLPQWREWFALRTGVYSPCEDCTPAFRDAMGEACRCERPEVIFVQDEETGAVWGVSGEDPRYARILLGLSPGEGLVCVGRKIEWGAVWARLLKIVRRRAHRDVKQAIDIWLAQYRRQACRIKEDKGENLNG